MDHDDDSLRTGFRTADLIDDAAIIEDLFTKHRLLASSIDLNALEYFGLVWPMIKTIAWTPGGEETPIAETDGYAGPALPGDGTAPPEEPGFMHALPSHDAYWSALLAPEIATQPPGVWLEHANRTLAGRWRGKRRHAVWEPYNTCRVTRRTYWRGDFDRILTILKRTSIAVNALYADADYTRNHLGPRLSRMRDSVDAPDFGHAGLRLYLRYLKELDTGARAVWSRMDSIPTPPWKRAFPSIVTEAGAPTTKVKKALERFRTILRIQGDQLAQLDSLLGIRPNVTAIAQTLSRHWGASPRTIERELVRHKRSPNNKLRRHS